MRETIDAVAHIADRGIHQIGIRVAILKIYAEATAIAAGNGAMYFAVPQELNGMVLVSAGAHVYTASSAGAISIMIHNATDAVDMLSIPITIDVNEKDSCTAAAPPVVDKANDNVATGDEIRVDIDGAGSGAKGLELRLGFKRE